MLPSAALLCRMVVAAAVTMAAVMIWQPATAVSHRSSRYVLDNSYTVLRLEPDTKTMTPLFAIPQSTGVLVYRSRP